MLNKIFSMKGRTSRKEYWLFIGIMMLLYLVILFIDGLLGVGEPFTEDFTLLLYGDVSLVYNILILIPVITFGVRRLHDINKSGWRILLNVIPLIGGIWYLIYMVQPGTEGKNRYGAEPK